jgi:hypothetical protein
MATSVVLQQLMPLASDSCTSVGDDIEERDDVEEDLDDQTLIATVKQMQVTRDLRCELVDVSG